MPRKKPASVTEAKAEQRKYVRGPKEGRGRRLLNPANLTEFERELKREMACFLKALDFSYKYIATSLDLTEDVVKKWFQEPEMQEKATKLLQDQVSAGIKTMRSYTLEVIHGTMEMWRTTTDENLAFRIYQDFLDRVGLAKVNKSESLNKNEDHKHLSVDVADPSGLIDAMKDAPPAVQHEMAEHLEAVLALASEHSEREVTHNAAG